MAERVLEKLCELSFFWAAQRDELVDEHAVERAQGLERGSVDTGNHLGRDRKREAAIARVNTLLRIPSQEIVATAESGRGLDGWDEQHGRSYLIRDGFEYNERARL